MSGAIKGFQVFGLREAKRKLKAKERAAIAAIKVGIRQGSNKIRDAAKATSAFKDRTGKLRKAINTRMQKLQRGQLFAKVGPDPKRVKYGHLVELGHKLIARGKNKGVVPGRGFMKAAFITSQSEAKNDIADAVKKALE